MERIRQYIGLGLLFVGVLALPRAAEVAETTSLLGVLGALSECEGGWPPIGSLGDSSGLECNCTLTARKGGTPALWRFRSEPRIVSVDPEGPSRDKLEPYDVIVAIDGHLITTARGGTLFSAPPLEASLPLTIRREGREREVAIVPVPRCPEPIAPPAPPSRPDLAARPAPPVPPALPEPAAPAARPAPLAPVPRPDAARPASPAPPAPPVLPLAALVPGGSLMPRGWTGMGLSCGRCTIYKGDDDRASEWRFESPPEVYSVDPGGPAAEAGLERGDLLTHIDGLRLDSDAGGTGFSGIQPGQKVTWTIRRRGRSLSAP